MSIRLGYFISSAIVLLKLTIFAVFVFLFKFFLKIDWKVKWSRARSLSPSIWFGFNWNVVHFFVMPCHRLLEFISFIRQKKTIPPNLDRKLQHYIDADFLSKTHDASESHGCTFCILIIIWIVLKGKCELNSIYNLHKNTVVITNGDIFEWVERKKTLIQLVNLMASKWDDRRICVEKVSE